MHNLFDIFQRLDRTLRNRADAVRWRVTMTDTEVQIFRRPILTSEITLAAIGIGTAPPPVPELLCRVQFAHGDDHQLAHIDYERHPEAAQYVAPHQAHLAVIAYLNRIHAEL